MAIKVWNNAGVDINARLLAACVALVCLGSCGSSGRPEEKFPTDPAPAVNGPAWLGFANNAQHTALSGGAAQTLGHIVWQKYVDLDPPYSGSDLFIHYGSPVITDQNTVVLPIKTDARGLFRIEARSGGTLTSRPRQALRRPPSTSRVGVPFSRSVIASARKPSGA